MNHMNDDQLDATLRRFFVAEAEFIESTAVSQFEMADRLNVRTTVPWDRRVMILLAAALLLAGLVASAILGSRPPLELTQVDHTVPRLTAGACPSGLPEELVLTVETLDGTGEFPWSTLTLYADGQLLSKPASGTPTVRRLSPEGIQHVVERASAVDVEGNCRLIHAAGSYGSMYVATSDGFLSLGWGAESRGVHATTPGETAAVEALSDWLAGLDGWILDDWVVTATRPYVAEKWSVDIQRIYGGDGDVAGPDPTAFTFPDGTTLSNFGVRLPSPDPEDPVATFERCGVVSAAMAAEITSSLDSMGAPTPEGYGGWLLSEEAGSGNDIIVQMNPLDPFSPGCLEGLDRAPTPSASPDPLATFDPCSLLPNETASDVLGRTVVGEAHLSYLPGGMRDCLYSAGGGQYDQVILSVRLLTTSTADGRELARELFGSGLSEKEVEGARLYSNGCPEAAASCDPAIAISSAPYFVVLSRGDPQDASLEADLETLAAAVIDNIPTR